MANPLFCINSNLRMVSRVLNKLYAEEMKDSELQGTQFTLLAALSGLKEATITELADFLVMDQTTVTRSINLLKKGGYVRVQRGADRRERLIQLTEAGQTAVETTYPLWLKAQEAVWLRLGEEKVAAFFELAAEIVATDAP